LNDNILEASVDAAFSSFFNRGKKDILDYKGIWLPEEVVCGVPGMAYGDALPRNTSCGYPDNMNRHVGYKGKQWYFGTDGAYDVTNDRCKELFRDVRRMEFLYSQAKICDDLVFPRRETEGV
jgi:hypothetical protein